MQLSVLVLFGLLVVGALASLDSRILSSLPSLQHPNGGFSGANDEVTLEATKEALFLASVYGIRNQLNVAAVPGFIRTCERHDGGYGQTASAAKSDVESTRHALLALTYLNQEINVAQVAKFLSSRIDRATGLASNSEGEATSLRATATVLQTIELLGEGKSTLLQEVSASLLKFLNAHNAGDHFAFENTPLVAGNYYGVIIGRLVGFDFQDTQVWADFIIQQQSTVGAFYENGPHSGQTLTSTAEAVGTLSILGKIGKQRYGSLINIPSLKTFLSRTADTLHDAAAAHFSMAVVSMDDILRVVVSYEPANPALGVKDSRAVVGAQIKPSLTVKSFNTVAHSGLDVEVTYLLPGEPEKTQRLIPSTTNGLYVTDDYVESSKFGNAIFTFTATQFIETIGLMEFEIQDQVSFGYGIEVRPQAIHAPTNKAIAVREAAPLGTEFSFQVSLFTSTETQKTNGDFELIFNVLDASEVLVFSTVEDGRTRADVPIEFAWNLESSSLPTGYLTFQFNVRGADGIIHTSDAVQYVYSTTMIATEIEFDGGNNEFSLGSSVTIWMTPALLPDLKTVVALGTLDYAQNDITDKRQFVLDATTLAGSEVGSVRGVNHNGRYQFEMPFSHTLDSLGTMVFSFRFVTSSNHAVALSNYDSVAEEVLDDAHAVNATIVADLRASDITEQPTSGSLSYGNEVSLRFRLVDATTEKAVSKGKSSNVYLLLNHHDAQHDASFVSSKHAAVETADGELAITWHVDPNAIRGAGYLTVVAESADGLQTPISGADGKPLRYDVVIDGNIDIDFSATSTTNPFLSHTAFLAQVKLSSNGRPLEGAKLSVDVIPSSSSLETFSLPVANGPQGTYSVSWTAAHTKAVSGTYTLKFFREADRIQAAEIDSANEKKYRKERREKELRGQEVGEEEELPKTPVTALFEKTLTHTQTLYRPWPIRIEFLVFFVLAYTAYNVWPRSTIKN